MGSYGSNQKLKVKARGFYDLVFRTAKGKNRCWMLGGIIILHFTSLTLFTVNF